MKEPDIEGIATHDVPESCMRTREGADEAFDRGTCGPGIEPRNSTFQGADAVNPGGRQHVAHRYREMLDGPARSETPCTYGTSLHENREISGLPGVMVRRDASGRQ
jgi:hypothetical protein